METRHIRIEYEDALNSKKNLLSTEINLLHVLRKIKAYRLFRKRELASKNKLRIELGNFRKKISLMHIHLPQDNIKIDRRKRKRKTVLDSGPDIQDELAEIKKKLERLGKK